MNIFKRKSKTVENIKDSKVADKNKVLRGESYV